MPVLEVHSTASGQKYVTYQHKRHYLHNMRKNPLIAYVGNKEVIHYPSRKRTAKGPKALYNYRVRSPKRKNTDVNKLYNYMYADKKRKHKRNKQDPVAKQIKHIVHKNEMDWNHNGPKTLKDKQDLYQTCGNPCFMNTTDPNYAVCRKCTKDMCNCYPDCAGLMHVKRLAASQGNRQVENAALNLASQIGCDWTQLLQSQFATKYSLKMLLYV